jgi:wyosine [tRNA(Phe)-imidazoG37] synthetase (radical SAM superfamily)
MTYQYLFGPVPSRRLGMSLGVDLVPHKVCSLNCIYCECGKTTRLTLDRTEYVPVDVVLSELLDYFDHHPPPDYVTFSGAGEPTLNRRFGEVLLFLKDRWPDIPVAVLTNGSLLSDPVVRSELMPADLVLPSLDAATEGAFQRIDRPSRQIRLVDYIQGLVDFSAAFSGVIWLEVFILPGINDDIDNLKAMKVAIERIRPDRVQLNTLDRPGTVDDLRPANSAELQQIIDYWQLDRVEVIAKVPDRRTIRSYRTDVENAILETIARRPCTLDDLSRILGAHVNEINKYLGVLDQERRIVALRRERGVFYQLREK